jgi:hypothetical protein
VEKEREAVAVAKVERAARVEERAVRVAVAKAAKRAARGRPPHPSPASFPPRFPPAMRIVFLQIKQE